MTASDLFLFDMNVTQEYYILTENRDQPSPLTHTVRKLTSRSATYHHHHHHHHLALQAFVGFRLLSQVSPSSPVLSCFHPVFLFTAFLNLPRHPLAIVALVFLLV